jgi:hypothetical protein
MANINSKTEARKKVREAQARANEARLQRERRNVDDAASFLVELGRLAAVDEWVFLTTRVRSNQTTKLPGLADRIAPRSLR